MLLGAVNAFNDEVGKGKNILNNQQEEFSTNCKTIQRKKYEMDNCW